MADLSVIVLAGGASRRMGQNKALLTTSDGETLIGRVVRNLRPLTDDLIVVSNEPDLYAHLDVRLTGDVYLRMGPLAGLHAGLGVARHPWALAVACDMPLVNHRLVRYMVLLRAGHQAVVPRRGEHVEPLHALYHRSCLPAVEERLEAGDLRMISFYPAVAVRYVEEAEIALFDPEGLTFANANTPEDWERLRRALERGQAADGCTRAGRP
ncbi:MAG: molybdenum cofactor guanylyltransferase [Caldilineales bacterium]|nr:molybdenum cofactor guanylyltransferase [Caldilineales bacterium]MDW8319501.1 molybdenum cofactor guanylyltransferase [Anaerolineae bacterium]